MSRLRASRSRRHGAEWGYTLTEVLVAVVIVGVSVIAIVGALGSSMFSSRVHRNIVTGDAAVRAYASQLSQVTYVNCATPGSYPAMTNVPGGMTVTVAKVSYWTGSSSGSNFGSTCGTDLGAQQITLAAKPTSTGGQQVLVFVKRAP